MRGFPHSETAGSQDVDSSPTNIAANYVLLRHNSPRHPLSTCSVAENKRYQSGYAGLIPRSLDKNGHDKWEHSPLRGNYLILTINFVQQEFHLICTKVI